jgi:hypothetical protein
MILFQCWYCSKKYAIAEDRIGTQIACSCKHQLKVPKKNGGRCKVRRPVDWAVEALVYGGGGALLGFGLAALIVSQAGRFGLMRLGSEIFIGLTLFGFLFGLFGGEAGINFVGRLIRDREEN